MRKVEEKVDCLREPGSKEEDEGVLRKFQLKKRKFPRLLTDESKEAEHEKTFNIERQSGTHLLREIS